MRGALLVMMALLPACSIDIGTPSDRLEGARCGRVWHGPVPAQPDGCYVRGGNLRCYILPPGDPCAEEQDVFFGGEAYEVWCDMLASEIGPSLVGVDCSEVVW